jgi:polyphenol oxidase
VTGVRTVTEVAEERAGLNLWVHPEWAESFPGVVQGTTGAPHDLGLWGSQPAGDALRRWLALPPALGVHGVVHALQAHGAEVAVHRTGSECGGLRVVQGVDGHLTTTPGLLLAVSIADCVPIFLHHPASGAVAALHSGWRGTAAGILEVGVRSLSRELSAPAAELVVHLGPAICGGCYEVSPEVHRAVNGPGSAPGHPAPIDLREAIARRAVGAGVPPAAITISAHCTLCGPGDFFSHRGGAPERQMGLIGLRRFSAN